MVWLIVGLGLPCAMILTAALAYDYYSPKAGAPPTPIPFVTMCVLLFPVFLPILVGIEFSRRLL